jgi:hypothetical protein
MTYPPTFLARLGILQNASLEMKVHWLLCFNEAPLRNTSLETKVYQLVCFSEAPIARWGFVRETLVRPQPISPTMVVSTSQLLSKAWESDGFATQHCQRGLGVSSEADEKDHMLNPLLTELFSLEGKIGKKLF